MSEEKAAILQGNLKGCELSLNQPGCGIKAGRGEVLTEMCSLGPGRGNLSQVSAEGFRFWSVHFKRFPSSLKSTGGEGEWSEPWEFCLMRKDLQNCLVWKKIYTAGHSSSFFPFPVTWSSLQQLRRTVPPCCLIIPAGKIVNYFLL